MDSFVGKYDKRYVECTKVKSPLTYIIHYPEKSSEQCKVFNNSENKYSAERPSKKKCRKQ